jgi:hypothetical protein
MFPCPHRSYPPNMLCKDALCRAMADKKKMARQRARIQFVEKMLRRECMLRSDGTESLLWCWLGSGAAAEQSEFIQERQKGRFRCIRPMRMSDVYADNDPL